MSVLKAGRTSAGTLFGGQAVTFEQAPWHRPLNAAMPPTASDCRTSCSLARALRARDLGQEALLSWAGSL